VKEIILAAVSGAILVLLITFVLRVWHVRRRARAFVGLYLIALLGLAVTYWMTPQDLFGVPQTLALPNKPVGLLFAMFLYTAGFFGGVLQLYNLADRGLSLRMLIDIAETPSRSITAEQMVSAYSGGNGLQWMYAKRLEDMTQAHVILVDETHARLTPKGRTAAGIFLILKKFCRIAPVANAR
jgi:hypothetical protein